MRLTAYLLMNIVLTICLYSCKNGNQRTITETTPNDSVARYKRTYVTSDGYTIVESLGQAPLNSKSIYYDNKQRLIGWAGMASEVVECNFVRIVYDDEGKIEAYLVGVGMGCELDSVEVEDEDMDLTRFILDPDENHKNVVRYYLKRDGHDNIVEVSDPKTNKVIEVPQGWVIRPEIDENVCFWKSDLHGGWILLNFYVEPLNKNVKQYTIKKYCFYDLQIEYTYTNGEKAKVAIYSPKTHKPVVTLKKKVDKTNGMTFYDKTYSDDKNIYRSKWKDGVLRAEEKISLYGTTLRQILYVTSQDGKAVICYYKEFDYKTKKLVRTKEERQDRDVFTRWNKEENVMAMYDEMYEYWNTMYSVDL